MSRKIRYLIKKNPDFFLLFTELGRSVNLKRQLAIQVFLNGKGFFVTEEILYSITAVYDQVSYAKSLCYWFSKLLGRWYHLTRTSLLWCCGSPWLFIQISNFFKLLAPGIQHWPLGYKSNALPLHHGGLPGKLKVERKQVRLGFEPGPVVWQEVTTRPHWLDGKGFILFWPKSVVTIY